MDAPQHVLSDYQRKWLARAWSIPQGAPDDGVAVRALVIDFRDEEQENSPYLLAPLSRRRPDLLDSVNVHVQLVRRAYRDGAEEEDPDERSRAIGALASALFAAFRCGFYFGEHRALVFSHSLAAPLRVLRRGPKARLESEAELSAFLHGRLVPGPNGLRDCGGAPAPAESICDLTHLVVCGGRVRWDACLSALLFAPCEDREREDLERRAATCSVAPSPSALGELRERARKRLRVCVLERGMLLQMEQPRHVCLAAQVASHSGASWNPLAPASFVSRVLVHDACRLAGLGAVYFDSVSARSGSFVRLHRADTDHAPDHRQRDDYYSVDNDEDADFRVDRQPTAEEETPEATRRRNTLVEHPPAPHPAARPRARRETSPTPDLIDLDSDDDDADDGEPDSGDEVILMDPVSRAAFLDPFVGSRQSAGAGNRILPLRFAPAPSLDISLTGAPSRALFRLSRSVVRGSVESVLAASMRTFEAEEARRASERMPPAKLKRLVPDRPAAATEAEPDEQARKKSRSEAEAASAVRYVCRICMDDCEAGRLRVVVPCGHACVCDSCAPEVAKRSRGLCPVCRQPFETLLGLVLPEMARDTVAKLAPIAADSQTRSE